MAKIVKLYSDKERFEIISEFIQSGESMDAFQKKMVWDIVLYRNG